MKKLQRNILLFVASLALGSSLMSYKAHAQDQNTVQPVQGLAVFDAKGKRVGNVLGVAGSPIVAFTINGTLVVLGVEENGFSANGVNVHGAHVFFESSNCSGTPYADFGGPPPSFLLPPTVLNGTKLYVTEGEPRPILARSLLAALGAGIPSPCEQFEVEIPAATQVRLLIDLATQFQPPFTLR